MTVNVVPREEVISEIKALGGDVALLDGPDLAKRHRECTGDSDWRSTGLPTRRPRI
jgi:hypothetical protein